MKKTLRLLAVMILVIMAGSLVMLGCANPADGAAGQPGKAGEGGEKGTDGPIYLSGSVTTDGINDALASGTSVVFAGVLQSDAGTVIIPAGKNVKLVGTAAYTVNNAAAAFLIIEDASSSISGTGGITLQGAGVVIADQAVLDAKVTGTGTKLPYQTIGTDGTVGASPVAIKGDVSITDTGATGTAIKASELSGKTLYVVGDLTVSNVVTATAINVIGDVTAAAAITGGLNVTGKATFTTTAQDALTSLTAGSVESSKAITTTSNGAIKVSGELKTTAAVAVTVGGTGTLDVGSLDLAGDLTTGNGTVALNGDVTIADGKKITLGTAAVTLKKGAAIKAGANTVLSASGGNVVITPAAGSAILTATATGNKIGVSGQNIAITGNLVVAAGAELALAKDLEVTTGVGNSLVLTGAALTGGAKLTGTGKVVVGNASITGAWQAVGNTTSIAFSSSTAPAVTITGTGTTPKLVGATGGVISTGAQGTSYSAITVSNAEIDLTTAGSILIPHNGTASTIVLKGGTTTLGKITLDSAAGTSVSTATYYAKILKSGESAKAEVSGSGIVVTGGGNQSGTKAGSIAGGTTAGDNDATLTGLTSSNNVTLDNSAVFADS